MITMPIVEKCPHTVRGAGMLRLSHRVIAQLAGAVYDRQEWIALLVGTRSPEGLDITVNEMLVPLQERSLASCELVREEPLENGVIGVVHSHHNMRAFFSQIDDDTLNPRFPVSLVVAHNTHSSSESEQYFGFDYQAEGRAALPCGSMGILPYHVMPFPVMAEWPVNPGIGFGEPDTSVSLGDCPHTTKIRVGFQSNCETKCGIKTTEKVKAMFGRDGKDFIKLVETQTRRSKYQGNYSVVDNRYSNHNKAKQGDKEYNYWREEYLRHWGDVGY